MCIRDSGSDIQYTIGGSLSDATSEVTEYANPTGTNPKENWYTGKKVGEIWGYRADGLIQTQEEADAYNEKYDLSFISGKDVYKRQTITFAMYPLYLNMGFGYAF